MALPAPRTHWRLSEIAEELENLDMSLDMDLSKDMDEFLRGPSVESDTFHSNSDNSNNGCSDTSVHVRREDKNGRNRSNSGGKSHYARSRVRLAPNVPPPPPPTQTPPTTTPAGYRSLPPQVAPPPPPAVPTSPPPVPTSPPPLPPPETPPVSPPVNTSPYSGIYNGVSVLPPLPKTSPKISRQSSEEEEDLPPPPPIFDLPGPNYAPPSPCTSPLILTNDHPLFRLSTRVTSPSPLTLSDTTSGYSTSCASSTVTSCPERTSIVYAPTSVASTSSDQPSDLSDDIDPVFEKITEDDIHQIEMFYRSHKSQVYVCPGIANLYIGPASQDEIGDKWVLTQTGIPVLLMDTGDARRQRKLQIILAEKGSGFILWRDTIDQLSNFKSVHSNFQSMFLSNDHTKLAGLSYDDENAANEFLTTLLELTSDPNDEALKMSKKKKKVKKSKYKAPKKTDISQPCGFVHVTKLDRNDHEQYSNQGTTPILTNRNQNNMSH